MPRTAAAALTALLAAGCTVAAPAQRYVGDSTFGAVVEIPRSWRGVDIDEAAVFRVAGQLPGGAQVRAFSAGGAADTLFSSTDTPAGWLLRRDLAAGEDGAEAVWDSVFPYRAGLLAGTIVSVEAPQAFTLDGLDGQRLAYEVTTAGGSVRVWLQGVTSDAPRRLYVIAVACSSRCEAQHRAELDSVLASWKVYP